MILGIIILIIIGVIVETILISKTLIDLLNKIANGEEVPKHIHIRDVDSYTWQEDVKEYWSDRDENNLLSDLDLSSTNLKEDVEIIEEDKKIRKIKVNYSPDIEEKIFYEDGDKPRHCVLGDAGTELLINKINEIIDYIMEDK